MTYKLCIKATISIFTFLKRTSSQKITRCWSLTDRLLIWVYTKDPHSLYSTIQNQSVVKLNKNLPLSDPNKYHERSSFYLNCLICIVFRILILNDLLQLWCIQRGRFRVFDASAWRKCSMGRAMCKLCSWRCLNLLVALFMSIQLPCSSLINY